MQKKMQKKYRGITLNNIIAEVYFQVLLTGLPTGQKNKQKFLIVNLDIKNAIAQQTGYLFYISLYQKL